MMRIIGWQEPRILAKIQMRPWLKSLGGVISWGAVALLIGLIWRKLDLFDIKRYFLSLFFLDIDWSDIIQRVAGTGPFLPSCSTLPWLRRRSLQPTAPSMRIWPSSGSPIWPIRWPGWRTWDQENPRHFQWQKDTGGYAVLNRHAQELYLMDEKIYKSMMIQMLIQDPSQFEDDFELVVDKYPWNRAYRVKK